MENIADSKGRLPWDWEPSDDGSVLFRFGSGDEFLLASSDVLPLSNQASSREEFTRLVRGFLTPPRSLGIHFHTYMGTSHDGQAVEEVVFGGEATLQLRDGGDYEVTLPISDIVAFTQNAVVDGNDLAFRILRVLAAIAPSSLRAFEGELDGLPRIATPGLRPSRRSLPPTISKDTLSEAEMLSVLCLPEGRISYTQFVNFLCVKPEALKRKLIQAKLVPSQPTFLRGWTFSSSDIRGPFISSLRAKTTSPKFEDFIRLLEVSDLIPPSTPPS
jgi:hypothetical protein